MKFKIKSKFKPAGDQPNAIAQLVKGVERGAAHQTLLGVTGSGKSVPYDTPVLVREKGISRLVSIGELCDRYFNQRGEGMVSVGKAELLTVSNDALEALSFSPITGVISWKQIVEFTRHAAPQQLYCVITTD